MKTKQTPGVLFTTILAGLSCSAYAISGDSGVISGSVVIDGDLNVTAPHFEGTYNRPAIYAGEGQEITLAPGSEDAVVTITADDATNSVGYFGLNVEKGGTISLGKVVIGGDNILTGLMATGAGSTIIIGDDSVIDATNNGSVASLYAGAHVEIGNNAVLKGNRWGSGDGVISVNASTMVIGNFARITNDGTGDDTYGHHQTIHVGNGGSITIGTDSVLTNYGDGGGGLAVVSVGMKTLSGQGTADIGDRAEIVNHAKQGYGLWATLDGSKITLGKDSTILTTNESAFGVLAYEGGLIEINDGTKIETRGDGSYGLYANNVNEGSVQGDSTIVTGKGVEVKTAGKSATAVSAYVSAGTQNSIVRLGEDNVITTGGVEAYGAVAFKNSMLEAADGLKITTTGESAYGLLASGENAKVTVGENARIVTGGNYASGVYAGGKNATLTAENGLYVEINGDDAGAVEAKSGGSVTLKDTTIRVNGDSWAMYSASGTENISSITGNGKFDIIGGIYTGTKGSLDVTMTTGSKFTGFTGMLSSDGSDTLNLAMTGSTWTLVDDSTLTNFSADSGTRLIFAIGGNAEEDYIQIFADSFTMSDASIIEVTLADDFIPMLGDEFKIVVSDGYNIGDIIFDLQELSEGLVWETSAFAATGIISVVAGEIPEPAAVAAILGFVSLAFAAYRRRK